MTSKQYDFISSSSDSVANRTPRSTNLSICCIVSDVYASLLSKTIAPYATPQWVDKSGKIYTPKNAKDTFKWDPTTGNKEQDLASSLHNGADQSQYRSHNNYNAAPKQLIVRIENLMRVDHQTIDMTDDRQVAAITNVKQELATALLDVVQDFNANMM